MNALLWILLFLAGIGLLLYALLPFTDTRWSWWKARSWPVVDASYESGAVEEVEGESGKYLRVRAMYGYAVDGAAHRGRYQEKVRSKEDGEKLLGRLRRGPLRVRVHPRRPEKSLLNPYSDGPLDTK